MLRDEQHYSKGLDITSPIPLGKDSHSMAIPVNGRLTATLYAACMKCKSLRAQQKEIYRVQQRA